MSSLTKAVANALSFANLRGLVGAANPASSAAKAGGDSGDEDDKRKRKDDESDGDYATRMKAMDDMDDDGDKKKDGDAKASAEVAVVRESAKAAGFLVGLVVVHGLHARGVVVVGLIVFALALVVVIARVAIRSGRDGR